MILILQLLACQVPWGRWEAEVEIAVPPVDRDEAAPRRAGKPDERQVRHPSAKRPNVLFIVWDTVRADHLSLYGHNLPTTPRLDAWAEKGVVYEHAVSPGVWTLPSHASMFTGLPVAAHGVGDRRKYLDDDFVTFAEVLEHGGYDTWAWSSNPFLGAQTNLLQGFERVEHPWRPDWRARAKAAQELVGVDELSTQGEFAAESSWAYRHVSRLADKALFDWLERRRSDKPFLAFINLMEAHVARSPALPWRERLMSPEAVARSQELDSRNRAQVGWMANGTSPEGEDLAILRGVYDAAISEMDDATGALLDRMRDEGLLDDTLVVLVADHGELLGEHGQWGHQLAIWNELTRVPLVVLYPGGAGAGRHAEAFSTAEVYRIILETTGVDLPPAARAGMDQRRNEIAVVSEYTEPMRSVLNTVRKLGPGRDLTAWDQGFVAAELGGTKLISGTAGLQALYDLGADRAEQHPVVDPAKVAEIAAALTAWRATFRSFDHEHAAPVKGRVDDDPNEQGALRELGYVE